MAEERKLYSAQDPADDITVSDEDKTISYRGRVYRQTCNERVIDLKDGTTSVCIKILGHEGLVHEDFDGRTRYAYDFGFSTKTLEEAVYCAIGAASVCWEKPRAAGVFQTERATAIGEQLMKRIREAGPIYE